MHHLRLHKTKPKVTFCAMPRPSSKPDWDRLLWEEIENIGHPMFLLSATAIEPRDTGNACVIVRDYGDSPANFERERLLREFGGLTKADWQGSTWPPVVLHRDLWDLVGGLSIDVDTFKGVVTLSGRVKSQAEKDQAITLARRVEGVTEVKDALQVIPEGQP